MIVSKIASLILLLASASTGWCAPIVFTHSVVASGSLDGAPFLSLPIMITAFGDTSNRIFDGDAYSLALDSAVVDIHGLGTFTLLLPLREFLNPAPLEFGNVGTPIVGLSRGPAIGFDLLDGPSSPDFSSWAMTASIGPIT